MRVRLFAGGQCTHPEFVVIRGGGFASVPMPSIFALIDHPSLGPTLFDTGYSSRFFELTRWFPDRLYAMVTPVQLDPRETAVAQLAALGLAPGDVRTVVLSHFHADHVAAAADFPRARFIYDGRALAAMRPLSGLRRVIAGFLPGLLPADLESRSTPLDFGAATALPGELAPFDRGVDLAGDGSLWAVELAGHVPGQMGLYVRAADGDWFLSADACWYARGFRENVLPHPVVRLITDDWAEYARTLGRLHALHLRRPDLRIVPSHCRETLGALTA